MQAKLTGEEIAVLKKMIGDKETARRVFECGECKHFIQHYMKNPKNPMIFDPLYTGHCPHRNSGRHGKGSMICDHFEPNVKEA